MTGGHIEFIDDYGGIVLGEVHYSGEWICRERGCRARGSADGESEAVAELSDHRLAEHTSTQELDQ